MFLTLVFQLSARIGTTATTILTKKTQLNWSTEFITS